MHIFISVSKFVGQVALFGAALFAIVLLGFVLA